MLKYLVTLEVELTGFIVDFFDTEVEAELCQEKLLAFESQYAFRDMYKVAEDFKGYIRKYNIPEQNRYTCKFYRCISNGSLTINFVKIDTRNFNIDMYIASRQGAVPAIDITDEEYEIIFERINDYFPNFYISAN